MPTVTMNDPGRSTGFRPDQLARAFDRVMEFRDWKAPIRAEIAVAERDVVEEAVSWFTASRPTFIVLPGHPDRLLVTAAGFRQGIAAHSAP
jgi:hypothetical protein